MRGRIGLGGVAAIAGIALILGGCAGVFGSDDDQPAPPPGVTFTFNGVDWLVADDAASQTLTISTTAPQVTGPGTLGGYRLNLSQNAVPDEEFRAAAKGWFVHGGRYCTVLAAAAAPADENDGDGWFGWMFTAGDDSDTGANSGSGTETPANARVFSYSCDWLP